MSREYVVRWSSVDFTRRFDSFDSALREYRLHMNGLVTLERRNDGEPVDLTDDEQDQVDAVNTAWLQRRLELTEMGEVS